MSASELPKTTGWQPIETAPRDGRDVLLIYGDRAQQRGVVVGYYDSQSDEFALPDWGHTIPEPSHWMPLPELPADA